MATSTRRAALYMSGSAPVIAASRSKTSLRPCRRLLDGFEFVIDYVALIHATMIQIAKSASNRIVGAIAAAVLPIP